MAKRIVVHKKSNTLEYFEGSTKVGKWDCVVGNDGSTDVGSFKVMEKVRDKVSNKYKAPMPFSLKFSSDWKAIHGTGYALVRSWAQWAGIPMVGSHGCVGLTNAQAETLFNWAPVGTPIIVQDD